jgi:hypothetical protein
MSATNNNRSRAPALKKFCKVCQDAGKSEKEYTSHFVRSAPGPNGVVVCPTLLSQECRYCYGRGHTVKFCTVLEKNKKGEAFAAVASNQKKVVAKEKQVNPANSFDALYASDNDEEEELVSKVSKNTNIVDEFPVLGAAKKESLVKANAFSYAAALATEVKPKPLAPVATPVIKTTPVRKWKTWADCDSSSDEDEDEEEVVVQKPVVYEDNSAW